MKKLSIALLILIFCFSLCSCKFPLSAVELGNNTENKITLYVSGAVERDGYYTFAAGTDYATVIMTAGFLPCSVLPDRLHSVVDKNVSSVIVGFYHEGVATDCINVNGILVTDRLPVDCVSSEIINKLADYIELYGAIHNRSVLKTVLGDDYSDNYYKFYISESDYA